MSICRAVCVSSASTVLGGVGDNWCMAEIMWHRRETRRQTENTNINLEHWERPIYSTLFRSAGTYHEKTT
jgi:hypothetical protein